MRFYEGVIVPLQNDYECLTGKFQDRKDEAISLVEKCFQLWTQVLSPQHLYTIIIA